MELPEWCISVLKGKKNGLRLSELYNLCTKHYSEQVFGSEGELPSLKWVMPVLRLPVLRALCEGCGQHRSSAGDDHEADR